MPPTLIIGGYGGTSLKFKPTMFKLFLYLNTALALAYQLLPPKYSFYSLTLSMYWLPETDVFDIAEAALHGAQ